MMFGRCWFFFFSSRRRHTRCSRDWSSDVCSSDLVRAPQLVGPLREGLRHPDEIGGEDRRVHQETGILMDADRKSTRLNSSHGYISYAVFCLKKKKKQHAE